ncbi:MAG: hypothetical protein HQ522_08170 [Bacteroidetes bacterium]|nr:hypothetical protein [Bacteroidota bacterium]
MTDKEFKIFLKEQDFIGSDFFEESFKFWFEDNEQIRTPFPDEIKEDLKEKTFRVFMEWVFELSDDEKSKLKNDEIVETFEMILFNQAMGMVEDEDQKITICYPFMPRLGDVVDDKEKGASKVISRKMDLNKDEKKYLKVKLISETVSQEWETEFELPA